MNTKKYPFLLSLFLAACASSPDNSGQKIDSSVDIKSSVKNTYPQVSIKRVELPLSSQGQRFICQDGNSFALKFMDNNKSSLQLDFQNQKAILKRSSNANPVIYANDNIAVFSDGKAVILAKPYSDTVLAANCRIN